MLTTEINTRELVRAFKIAPAILKEEIADGMDHISRKFFKILKKTRFSGRPGLRYFSHGLFTYFKRVRLDAPTIGGMGMEMYTTSKIAKIHEEGAVLRDPSGGKLAVPLSARTEMFTAKGRLRRRFRSPGRLKNVERMKLRGKEFLVKVKKRTKEVLPYFVLKNKVKIKPRLEYYKTWDRMENERILILNRKIDKALRRI